MKEFRPTPIYKNHSSVDTSPYMHQYPKGHLLGNKGPVPKNRDFISVSLSVSLSLTLSLCLSLWPAAASALVCGPPRLPR